MSLKDLAPVPGEEQTLDLTRQIAGRDRDLVEPEVENDLVSLLEVGRLANREMDDGLLLRIVAAALGCDSALQHVLNRAPTPRNYGQPSAVVGASTALRLRVANGLTGNLPRVAYLRAFPAAIERGGLQAAKTAERVPAGYWPSLINAAISSLGTGSLKTGAALAVATVLVGNRSLEAEARRHLGLYQSWGATSVIGHGSAPGEIAVLARVGDAAVAAHEGRVPIDYARRRILASEILSERDWMVVARMSGFRPIADDLPRARLLASTIFGGANLDLRADKDTWRFVRILPHTVFFRLVEHLEGTLREAEIDEPLLWDPEPDPLVDLAREGRSILSQTTKTMRQVATELGTSPGALTAALAMNARTLAEELGATRGAIRHDVSTADIVAGFQGGQTVREVADRVGATKDRVRGILHTLGVPTPIGRKTLEIDRDWLITKYATSSFNEIARELGVSPPVVTRQARQYGIVPRIGTPSHVAVLRPEADSLELPEPLRAALACPNGKVRTARFVSLAFFVSFVEAAQELGAGPAVLSTQIKALEGCVGERLVARPSKKLRNAMRFTQTGELLCKQGAQFFGVVLPEPLLEPVAQVADSLQGLRVLRLAVLCDAAGSIAQAARMIGRHEWSVANSITRWEARFGLNLLRWDFVAGSCELTEVGLLAWAQWQCRATIKATSPRLFEVATTPDRLTLQ
ncbi:MAG TPA: LysR family transcriptional regulator [Acidimicrobiales bacterium]|nr:LysR family transcriptional regulator [Acidimicrobiales bacterium]